jgi:hypothetical protein
MAEIVEQLIESEEPSVRYKVRVGVLGEGEGSRAIRALREEIRESARVRALLSERSPDGTLTHHPYHKWLGSHWVLTMLRPGLPDWRPIPRTDGGSCVRLGPGPEAGLDRRAAQALRVPGG